MCEGVSPLNQEEEEANCLETLISGEDDNLNLHNKLSLVYFAFPGNLPEPVSPHHPKSSFVFSWRLYLGW